MLDYFENLLDFIDDLPIGIVCADPTGKHDNCYNQFALDMFGYTPEEGDTRENWYKCILPDDDYRAEIITKWRAIIADTNERKLSFSSDTLEGKFTCKDGSTRWCTIRYYPKEGLSCAIFTDISERKKAEDALAREIAKKELLLRELNHRVKNNLQVITSIISLQASKKDTSSILQETENRIAAIALAYEKLTFPDKSDLVELQPYLQSLVNQLLENKEISPQKELCAPDISIDIQHAVTLGLIISECYSNTLKYAFDKNSPHPKFTVHVEENNGGLVVTIFDNGKGFPLEEKHQGTGLEIITTFCKNRFKTTPEIFNSEGAVIKITIDSLAP